MNYDWSWSVFLDISPDGTHSYLQTILIGVGWTLALSLGAGAIAMLLGSVVAVLRTVSRRALNVAGMLYVELFRNIPLLVQMFLWYYVLPAVVPAGLGKAIIQMPQPWNQFLPALLCLGFYGAARVAEQLRACIQALPAGQLQAGTAIGLTEAQAFRYVILPEAYRLAVPLLTSEFMAVIKYSSVALTIGLLELTGQARSMQEFSFHIFEAFSAATACYLLINSAVILAARGLERRAAIPGLGSAPGRQA